MSKRKSQEDGPTLRGCLGFIVGMWILWAALFGLTWSGKHHEVSCSCDRGVVVQ